MDLPKSLLLALVPSVFLGCATTGDSASWSCSAEGLADSYYDGSNYAKIHLRGYARGGTYEVVKNAEGTRATGTTANGTPFSCTKSP